MPQVGQSIPHESAFGHVTGSARYIDDLPRLAGELYVDFAGSPVAAGQICSLNLEAAKRVPGVVCILTHEDLRGPNHFGPIFADEPFLAAHEVSYIGQPVVVIAAESAESAFAARRLVKINCLERTPILSIDDAIHAESYIGPRREMTSEAATDDGDFAAAFKNARHTLRGRFHSGGQEQFYFETQSTLAIPGEADDIKVISSTQNTSETQTVVAEALGLGRHQVICECHRMGGGFGGKETQAAITAVMAALVAQHTGRPARLVLRRGDDMLITGKRHEYQTDYRVAFDNDGLLVAAEFNFYSNGGAFADLSTSVLDRTLLHADNAYFIPKFRVTGQVCRTNLPPNTAFRGFGGPQGMAVIENCLQDISRVVGRDAFDVRRLNLYRDGDPKRNLTHYSQIVRDHVLEKIFDTLVDSSDYRRRIKEATEFNRTSPTKLKGLAMSAVKFGISFTTTFLNQANALVNVYTDGTVQVSSGGTEMGQGLYTKLQQVVADEFGLPLARVRVMPTSSEKSNNTSPTAASAGMDLNGAAALEACRQIKERMRAFAARLFADPKAGQGPSVEHIRFADGKIFDDRRPERQHEFGKFCDLARRERVDLGARGFFATPGINFNKDTNRGSPFYYYTTGAAVAEVTIDRFTGELVIDRADLLMDVGQMINPGIDRGQVIGGFVQGMGWVTNEELRYDPQGRLLNLGPTTYKMPNITDIPAKFYVNFIDNPKHTVNIRRSKAVAEPPLMLGLAVWLAAKHALGFLNPAATVDLPIPATGEAILSAIVKLGGEQGRSSAGANDVAGSRAPSLTRGSAE